MCEWPSSTAGKRASRRDAVAVVVGRHVKKRYVSPPASTTKQQPHLGSHAIIHAPHRVWKKAARASMSASSLLSSSLKTFQCSRSSSVSCGKL